jgi:hypothetical protein
MTSPCCKHDVEDNVCVYCGIELPTPETYYERFQLEKYHDVIPFSEPDESFDDR